MASYHNLLQHTKQRFESPAKVFAKLKSKVHREAMCAKEGACPDKSPSRNVREKHVADFNSPRKRTANLWINNDFNENHKFGSYRKEVQAVTLSPISSPQKTVGHSYLETGDRMPPGTETEHAFIARHRRKLTDTTVLESTAVSALVSLGNRKQILSETTGTRNLDGCKKIWTPLRPVQNDCVRSVFGMETGIPNQQMPSFNVYSPMKERLRKRKWDQDISKVTSTAEDNAQAVNRTDQWMISPVLSDDDFHNTGTEDLCSVTGTSPDQSSPPRPIIDKRCSVIVEKFPLMSPAKMFAYMKEREKKREQQEAHDITSSTRKPFNRGDLFQSPVKPPSTAHKLIETGDANLRNFAEAVTPVKRARVETAEDVVVPAVQSQPVLLEDPLVLNSPRVSIPKKQSVFQPIKVPPREKVPNDNVIYLKHWFLRKTYKGLFVDGIHREQNIPWNSNIIEDRVSDTVLKTVSGRVYILVGKMKIDVASGFPKWFLKKFVNGFPPNWKALYEKEAKMSNEERNAVSKKNSEVSSVNVSVQRHRPKPSNTPASCPPASSIKVSRSGRTIKPPLEYWKGGRVLVDAQMNVTIHECYDTSICIPEVTTMVTARKSKKPTRVFLPCSEGHKQCESPSEEEVSVPVRKVKASRRKHNQAKTDRKKMLCNISEHSVETASSPEERSRSTKSRQRYSATERVLHSDTVPQRQREPERASTRSSKNQMHDTNRPPVRGRKKAVTTTPESLSGSNKKSQQQSSDDDFSTKSKTQKGDNRKRRGKVLKQPQQDNMSPSSESLEISDDGRKKRRNRTRTTQINDTAKTQRKCNKVSPPTNHLLRSMLSSKKQQVNKGQKVVPQEQDEDEWTDAELMKLQEAVTCYPKHVTGYWAKVARMVGTRSAAECHNQYTSQGISQTPAKKAKKHKKEKVEAPKDPVTDHPVISAGAGTFKRKQQVRQFLEAMPKEDVDDIFGSTYMQNKRFEIPSMCPSDDHDFAMSDLEPLTPMSKIFPDVKTPQCLHITPGMMGSPNSNNDDKYVYQLQKRMKKNQFNVCKQAPTSKSFTPTPAVKRTMRRCGTTENDTFVVWEMFPGNEGVLSDSGEEEDFYFSDND